MLASDPDSPGSLGLAISEAVEMAAQDPTANYALLVRCSTVLLHQTIIGEALLQLAKIGESVDLIVGCTGGGSNFGETFPFLREKLASGAGPSDPRRGAPSCPSLTQGTYAYDFGDVAGLTPMLKMHTLGHDFIPDPIHAGGLRYHGMSRSCATSTRRTSSRRSPRPGTASRRASLLRPYRGIVPASPSRPTPRGGRRRGHPLAEWRRR